MTLDWLRKHPLKRKKKNSILNMKSNRAEMAKQKSNQILIYICVNLNSKCIQLVISHDITASLCFYKVCPELRCTSCDFKVVRFENARWRPQCDYLFFRNYRTNMSKLKAVIPRPSFFLSYFN